jgi:hypothetical protein
MTCPIQRNNPVIIAVAFLGFLASSCLAETITVSYSGTIIASTLPGIAVGDTFTGSATYSVPEIIYSDYSSEPGFTVWFAGPGDAINFAVDGYEFSYDAPSTPASAVLWEQSLGQSENQDRFGATTNSPGTFATNYPNLTLLQLNTGFVWPTDTLVPGVPPDPFDVTDLQLGLPPLGGPFTGAEVFLTPLNVIVGLTTEVQVTSTPEPRTGLWLGALLLAFLPARSLHRRMLARRWTPETARETASDGRTGGPAAGCRGRRRTEWTHDSATGTI